MEFRGELASLLSQIPPGRVSRLADLAAAMGDPRAAAAIARVLRGDATIPGAGRVVTEDGRAVSPRAPEDVMSSGASFADFGTVRPLESLRREQLRLAARVSRRNGFSRLGTVGGVDVAYEGRRGFAALVVLRARDLAVVEQVLVARPVEFPYIPTYLAYREFPLIRAAFDRLAEPPSVLLVDGHGQLHPAGCGIACMVGVKLDVPTIGVAKSPLVGTPDHRPRIGVAAPIRLAGNLSGYAVRTSPAIRPLYVSTGHRVGPGTALRIVRRLCVHRHPEPLRLADQRASEWKRSQGKMFKEGSRLAPTPRAIYRKRRQSD